MTIKELIEKRATAYNSMKDLIGRAKTENREMSQDEQNSWDKWNKDFDSYSKQITIEEQMRSKEQALSNAPTFTAEQRKVDANPEESYTAAFNNWMRRGNEYITPEQRNLLQTRGTATQVTSTANLGGYLVPKQFSNELERTMKDYASMLQVCRIVNTANGGTLEWPTVDDTSATGEWVTQGNAVTVADMTFGQKTFSDYTVATLAKVSFQLLNDEAVNLTGEVALMFAERLGRTLNLAFTTGDGSGKPTGFVTDATTGETGTANVVTRANLLDLIHSVDPAYRRSPQAAFMMNDATLAAIKKLSIGSGDDRPLWVPSMRDGAPDTIEGFRYVINPDMANLGTATKPIAFGDWSKYIIRTVGTQTLLRLNERYADSLTTGFLLYGRFDGKLLNTSAIKVFLNS